jgi:hypothetical protein
LDKSGAELIKRYRIYDWAGPDAPHQ